MADLDRPDWQFRFDTLRRRRRILFWTTLATLVVVEAFVLGLPNLYRAGATLMVQAPGQLGSEAGPGATNTRLQAIKAEAMSRGKLTELVERFDLYGADGPGTATQGDLDAMQRDFNVDVVSGDTNPNSGQTTTVAFRVSYIAKDPNTAAAVSNALADFYISKNETLREQVASAATQSLQNQIDETRREIADKEARIKSYTSRNIGALPQQLEANMNAVMRLDGNLRLNSNEQMQLLQRRQALLSQIAEIDTRVPPPDDTNPASVLQRLQSELVELRTRVSDSHPDVRLKRAEIAQLEQQIKSGAVGRRPGAQAAGASPRAAAEQALKEVEAQLDKIEKDNASLRSQIAAYEGRVNNAPAHETVFEGLVRDLQATRDRHDALLRRFDEARMTERAQTSVQGEEFRVLDAAIPPVAPTGPSRLLLLGFGALFALVVGVAVTALADRRDTSFHSLDELRSFTRVPVLASIPEIVSREGRAARRARSAAMAGATLAVLAVLAAGAFYLAHGSDQIVRVLARVI